jgi:signal peptidase I
MTEPRQPALEQSEAAQAAPSQGAEPPASEESGASQAALGQIPAEPAARQQDARPANRHPGSTQSLLTVIVFTIFVITFIVQAFQIPSGSMENTLLIGDFLLVDKLHFAGNNGLQHPVLPYRGIQRGDIIVFYYPVDPSQFLVKRVIGLPGERVHLKDKIVYVNGAPLKESYAIHTGRNYDGYRDNFPLQTDRTGNVDRRWSSESQQHISHGELVVPEDEYFVMGDNREQSADSRYWGFVPRANIVGRPLMIYLSVKGEEEAGSSNDKLFHSGQMLAHLLQKARWDRMFHMVR